MLERLQETFLEMAVELAVKSDMMVAEVDKAVFEYCFILMSWYTFHSPLSDPGNVISPRN